MHSFVSLCISHLESIGSLIYAEIPNVDTFNLTTFLKKSHLLISPTEHIRKIFQWREAVKQKQFFQNSKFLLRARVLSLPTNTLSCFPWCDWLTLSVFKKMSAKYPSLANIVVCQLSLWVKMVFHRKAASSAFNVNSHSRTRKGSPWTIVRLWCACSASALCILRVCHTAY